jgi:hypothetical protein
VINDIGFIDMMNARLVPAPPAVRTPGDAVAGRSLHGLGCAQRPVSLTPQLCARTPLDRLVHDGSRAEMCTRVTRGRTRAEAEAAGGALRWHARALGVCARDGIDRRGNPRDTTRWSRRGESIPASDAQAMPLPHG